MGDQKIWESAKKKLLRMEIGKNINFDDHVISLCKKVGRKLAMLARLSKVMSFKQKRILAALGSYLFSLSLDIVHSSGCFIAGR